MKLLPATSFYLFLIISFLLFSCNIRNEEFKNKINGPLKKLDSIVRKKNNIRQFDSAIYFGHNEFNLAKSLSSEKYMKKSLLRLITAHRGNGNYDSAIFHADKLYQLSSYYKDTVYMAKASFKLGLNYNLATMYKESYLYYNVSKNLYLKLRDTSKAIIPIINIAQLLKTVGNYGESQLSSLEGLRYAKSYNDIRHISKLNYLLAVSSKEIEDYVTATRKIDEALSYVTDITSIKKIGKANIYKYRNTKANIFVGQRQFQDAINVYNEILASEEIKEDTIEMARVYNNLGKAIFLKKGFNSKSVNLFNKTEVLNEKKGSLALSFSNFLNQARLYKNENIEKSLSYIDKAICVAERMNNDESLREVLKMKIQFDTNTSKEIKDYYFTLDEIINKKRQNISTLHSVSIYDHNNAERIRVSLEKSESQKTKQVLFLTLILIVTLVLIFFTYQRIKRKHKIEKVKTVHVTEARISSKVHDELANDLYKLISQLETTEPEKEFVLDKLDVIYNQARDISKQIQGVETGEGFAEELSNLFRSYQSEEVNVLLKRYNIDIWNGISSHIKITVYRVLQELLTNMKKHSNAGLVVVSIEKENKKLFIQYIDNGRGFAEEISKNGLQNAENRIHAIKGTLTFDTELHTGCKFSINVPV